MAFGYSRVARTGGVEYTLLGQPRKGRWDWFFQRKLLGVIALIGLAVLFAVGFALHFIAASASAIILTSIIGLCLIGAVMGVVERYRSERDKADGGWDNIPEETGPILGPPSTFSRRESVTLRASDPDSALAALSDTDDHADAGVNDTHVKKRRFSDC